MHGDVVVFSRGFDRLRMGADQDPPWCPNCNCHPAIATPQVVQLVTNSIFYIMMVGHAQPTWRLPRREPGVKNVHRSVGSLLSFSGGLPIRESHPAAVSFARKPRTAPSCLPPNLRDSTSPRGTAPDVSWPSRSPSPPSRDFLASSGTWNSAFQWKSYKSR